MIKRVSHAVLSPPSEPDEESQEADFGFSEILYTKNQILPPQDFSLTPTYSDEIIAQIETAVIFPSMTNFTLEEMVEDMLCSNFQQDHKKHYFENYQKYDLQHDKNKSANVEEPAMYIEFDDADVMDQEDELQDTRREFTIELAMNSIFVSETVSNLSQCIQRTMFNDFDGIVYDDTWLIMLCELQSIKTRKIIIARLAYDMYIMPTCQAARCVILILANSAEKGMKGAVQIGTNFGTILSLPEFIPEFIECQSTEEIIQLFRTSIINLKEGQTQMHSLALALAQTEKTTFVKEIPWMGIWREIVKRFPYYLSDFTDGLVGYKTIPKLIAAVIFQYFATILPVIALGQAVDTMTKHELSIKTVVYSQFFGSILYGMFSGNPMMIFQVSSAILLYSKGLYLFSVYFGKNFQVLFSLTGIFSGILLMLSGIFNVSNYMVYSTGSVADMVDVFQAITFLNNVITGVWKDYSSNYNCSVDSDQSCNPGTFVLNILVMLVIMGISNAFRSIRFTRMFNITIREFLSDMWISFGVILTTLITTFFFQSIPLEPFKYDENTRVFVYLNFGDVELSMALMSFMLAIPLTLLIFLDHNLNGEFIADPRNKLHKGRTAHFDMFLVGTINCLFGFFGMCSMQGMFPNTPLHIKQMADVEETQDHGITVKTLVRVRDTRLSQLLVGLLIGVSLFLLPLPISYVPRSALDGLMFFIGYISLDGNDLIERLRLFFVDQSAFPSNHPVRKVAPAEAHKFSLLQIAQLGVISIISFADTQGYLTFLFPVALALLIPIRIYLIPRLFKPTVLDLLDPSKVTT